MVHHKSHFQLFLLDHLGLKVLASIPVRREFVVPLPITVDPSSETSLPTQISESIRNMTMSGALSPGDHLPSTRSLAQRLSVSRGTVVAAYEQLIAEGYVVTLRGSGTVVNPQLIHNSPLRRRSPAAPTPRHHSISLRPGRPYTADLADAPWRSAWRTSCTKHLSGDHDPLGLWSLRVQVAEHIRRMRSMSVEPERIAITAGAREGLSLVLLALAQNRTEPSAEQDLPSSPIFSDLSNNPTHSALTLGVESPGYPSLRRVPGYLGHRTVDLPTDRQGVDPSRFPTEGVDAVLITPNHQYPFGTVLPAPRRAQLARWARDTGTTIIEDDFDSELRYVGMPSPPVTADTSIDGVLLGTFSTVISPDLSCGYAVLPAHLTETVRTIRSELGFPVAAITQGALASFMASGALRRRTQRLRRVYRRRQEMVTAHLGTLTNARLHPITGGLHAVIETERDEDAVIADLERAGIGVSRLSKYWGGAGTARGIVFGFGEVSDEVLGTVLPLIDRATAP